MQLLRAVFININLLVATFMCTPFAHARTQADDIEPVRVAVAANFAAPLRAIAEEFTDATGVNVIVTVSSSGTLFAQLQHGAHFDVFLSADKHRPSALAHQGVIHADNVVDYAVGQLAFVHRAKEVSEENRSLSSQIEAALSMGRIAIANPKLAPYGEAAKDTLQSLGLWNSATRQRVTGKNVLQTYQFFSTKSVSGAFIAYSLTPDIANAPDTDSETMTTVLVPAHLHKPIVQSMAINSKHRAQLYPNVFDAKTPGLEQATQNLAIGDLFAQYVLSKHVQNQLSSWGYLGVEFAAKANEAIGERGEQ
jgi:molybdate transport system substrate-binding protein